MTYSFAASSTRPTSASSSQTVTTGATSTFNFTARGSANVGVYEVSITIGGVDASDITTVTFQSSSDGTRPFSADGGGEVFQTGVTASTTYTFYFTSRAAQVQAVISNAASASVTADLFENFETEDP